MKKFVLFVGLSLLSTIGFSQQVSSARNATVKPVENKEAGLQETVADSTGVLNSMSRNGQAEKLPVRSNENQQNTEKQVEKGTLRSTARKPD